MSGQAKIFIDRLFAEFHPKFAPQFKEGNAGKRLALVFTQGNPDRSLFDVYYDYTKSIFEKLEFNVVEPMIVATGTRGKFVSEDSEILTMARNLGQQICVG